MAASVIQVVNGSLVTGTAATVTSTLSNAIVGGDVVVALLANNGANGNHTMAGLGATWTRVGRDSLGVLDLWVGTGATATGTVTATQTVASAGGFKQMNLWHVRGTTTAFVGGVDNATSNTLVGTAMEAGPGQVFIGSGYAETSANSFLNPNPDTGWVNSGDLVMESTRQASRVHRIPTATESHYFSTVRTGTAHPIVRVVLGAAEQVNTLAVPASAGVTVTTALSTHHTRGTPVDAGVTVSTALSPHHSLDVPVDVEATATTSVTTGGSTAVPVAVDVTVSTTLAQHHTLAVPVSVGVSAATSLSAHHNLAVQLSVSGTVATTLDSDAPEPVIIPHITVPLSVETVTYTELFYERPPAELDTTPLGKLVSFSVSTSAVPLNPAEGSGAAPSVTAGYIKGRDTEFALGEANDLTHGAVGTYEGEVVRLSLPEGSDVATISQVTALTLLNNDLTLFPFIDAAPSVWTAARAIDYWTQQCGLFYDKVPGDVIAYASGYGHTDSYGAGTTARFYEKLTGGTTATTVLNGRSVKTLGSAATGTTAFHELPKGNVAVSVPKNRKLVASTGLGLRGTGRTATVSWNLIDSREATHTIALTATSAGLITASLGGVPVASATVASNVDYRLTFSIERVSATAVVGKLTVHTDDLAGSGALVFESPATGATYTLPAVTYLTALTHASTGGSGAEMLRWGTYLTVAAGHPRELPAVQKALSPTGKEFGFVSGFEGNVWSLLNEYCAITRQDVSFLDAKLTLTPRNAGLSVPVGNFSRFSRDAERRDKYKQVAVVNKQSKAVSTNDAVLWRADSVFQVAAREVFETTVQTGHSVLSLVQPVPVEGILPFPYIQGGGQYVVTGADGYIVAPAWWNDNGGKVEVSLTGKDGEIAIRIIAPSIDSVRAPYRISEGEADRPALYVAGSGILNDPKEVHVGTGASNAKEGFDTVFESPFIAGVAETYDTAAAMAAEYSASVAEVSFELPNDFYTPSRFGQYPAGTRFTDGKRNYRITDASQTHSRVSGNAVPHTTIGDYVASYPAGATLADEKARHAGRSIKQFNISPLKGN